MPQFFLSFLFNQFVAAFDKDKFVRDVCVCCTIIMNTQFWSSSNIAKQNLNCTSCLLATEFPNFAVYNQFKQTEKEKELFSLKGSKNSGKRMTLYTFLLNHMADEHRFQLTAKLCQVKGLCNADR